VVRLSVEERGRLEEVTRKGTAGRLRKVCILSRFKLRAISRLAHQCIHALDNPQHGRGTVT
jgi:hypothetical protein